MMKGFLRAVFGGVIAVAARSPAASAHDIYSGVHGKNGQLCCGGDDCAATFYRERRRPFRIPDARAAMDRDPRGTHHFPADSRRTATRTSIRTARIYAIARRQTPIGSAPHSSNVFDDIFLYCAFIPPGSI